jgi:hypothetical protein
MRTTILKRAWRTFRRAHFTPQLRGAIAMAALLLATTNLFAAETTAVAWLSGGPNPDEGIGLPGYGSSDGDITLDAEYHTPCGLAMDLTANFLFVADRDNNEVRILQFNQNATYHLAYYDTNYNEVTNVFSQPVGVALADSDSKLFVLNRGNGTNGSVFQIDIDLVHGIFGTTTINLTKITNAGGIAVDTLDNVYVTASNQVIKVAPSGISNIVATVTAPGASLQGIVMKRSGPTAGLLAVCDAGRNGILLIDPVSGVITTNAGFHGAGDFSSANNIASSNSARFYQPAGVTEAGDGTLIVSDYGNHRVKAVLASGIVTNLYGVSSNDWLNPYPGWRDGTVVVPDQSGGVAARLPNGVAFAPDGSVYVTEDYYHIIRHLTGAGLLPPPPLPPGSPTGLTATAGYGQVVLTWTTSSGATNYNIKRSTTSGGPYTNNIIGSSATNGFTDANVIDGTIYYYVVSALDAGGESQNSSQVGATPMFSPPPTILLPLTTNYNLVGLTWSTSPGATSYNVKRSTSSGGPYTLIINLATNVYNDTSVLSGTTYYYVISALNHGGEGANSLEASGTPPIAPPGAPNIGWFDYEGTVQNGFFTVNHPVSGLNTYTTHNDLLLAIDPTTNGVATYYIYTNGPQPVAAVPSSTNGSTPPFYQDGLAYATPLTVTTMPDLVIKAVNVGPGGSSAVTTAEFLFSVANPIINGVNAARFTVSDITSNVVFWYTIDGSIPTNAPPSIGPVTVSTNNNNTATFSLNGTSNILFQVRAFRTGYSPSGTAVQSFTPGNFTANTIGFGLASGEPSSKFYARPGQFFSAPVTLQLIDPSDTMFSLQFNVAVTNGLTTPNKVVNGAGINFFPMLMSQVPPAEGQYFPPLDGKWYLGIPNLMFTSPNNSSLYTNGTFVNTNINLIGVSWAYRVGFAYGPLFNAAGLTFLDFDTSKQDLITYSIAHDDVFTKKNGLVILGAYSFMIPTNAHTGDKYFIQLGSPSATRDGAGATGAGIYIQSPATSQMITVTNVPYLVGDAAYFNWFNAGDFGDGMLDSSDVQQVFQSAILGTDMPPTNSDLFMAMDSSGRFGFYDPVNNYYTDPGPVGNMTAAQQQAMFNGNDLSINTNCFGDGVLDVSDVYVTFRRSEDSSLNWWVRYWTNSQFVAVTTPNLSSNNLTPTAIATASSDAQVLSKNNIIASGQTTPFQQPSVSFSAGDALVTKGQTIQIPVNASIFGSSPLRILGLNLTVRPLDGSPALTQPVQFTAGALGQPNPNYFVTKGNDTFAAAWFPTDGIYSNTPGLTGNVNLGTLTITIPTNATSLSAYAVHFDHASASPNGIISFPRTTMTGLITLSSRTNSYYNDSIPDSWRLRYFGTIYNLLSVSNACASGDGIDNWMKYNAGADPNVANNFPPYSVNTKTPVPPSSTTAIHWPSVSNLQYVILRSSSLFSGSWTAIATNIGTGKDMEFDDNYAGPVKFYRVLVLP